MVDGEFPTVDRIHYKKIPNIQVPTALPDGFPAILPKQDSTHILLVEDVFKNTIALRLHKILGPEDQRHEIVYADKLRFG